jgi:hypothetical protein
VSPESISRFQLFERFEPRRLSAVASKSVKEELGAMLSLCTLLKRSSADADSTCTEP